MKLSIAELLSSQLPLGVDVLEWRSLPVPSDFTIMIQVTGLVLPVLYI